MILFHMPQAPPQPRLIFSLPLVLLVPNTEKTKYMVSTSDSDYPASITLNGTQITLIESYKYFRIQLDSRLSFKVHIHHLTQKFKIKLGFLYRIKG